MTSKFLPKFFKTSTQKADSSKKFEGLIKEKEKEIAAMVRNASFSWFLLTFEVSILCFS